MCAVGLARSGVYRPALPADDNDLAVMRRLDELFTAWPFLGSRRMVQMLKEEGYAINRKRVQRLMREMGIAALGPKPKTSKPEPGHRLAGLRLRPQRRNTHFSHQPLHPLAVDRIAFLLQHLYHPPRPEERPGSEQLVEPAHHCQIVVVGRQRRAINARARQ